jgi:iron complex outermembrane receptor protein
MRHTKSLIASAVGLLTTAISSGASAQLEEVIVTAQKRAQSMQDIPISVSAFTEDELNAMGAEDNNSIILRTPGLTGGKDNDNQNILMIRGIGTQAFAPGTDSSVGTYFNEVPVSRANAVMGFMDIQRVEVVKGPQGTLFGRNTASGAIAVTNNEAYLDDSSLDLRVAGGDEGQAEYEFAGNYAPTDNFAARLSGKHIERDGTYKSNEGLELNDRDTDQIRFSVQWQPTDNLNVKWFYDLYEFEYRWQPTSTDTTLLSGIPLAVTDPYASVQDITVAGLPKSDAKNELSVLQLAWDLNDNLTLSSNTGYFSSDSTGLSLNLDLSPFYLVSLHEDWDIEQYSQDFRLNGSTGNIDWFVGASYYEETAEVTTFVHFDLNDNGMPDLGTEIDFMSDLIEKDFGKNKSTSWAVYGDMTWAMTDRMNLTVGARYTEDKKEAESENVAGLYDDDLFIFFPSPYTQIDDDWNSFDPRVAIDYTLNDSAMVYASVAKGYKAGGINRFPAEPNSDVITTVDPEENITYETGIKADFLDSRARVNATLFLADYQDYQAEVFPEGSSGAIIVNTGDLQAAGLELDATFLLGENIDWRVAYAYVKAEFQDDDMFNGVSIKGNQPSRSPENTFSTNLRHNWELNSGTITSMLEYSWTDETYYTIFEDSLNNYSKGDAYGLLNARIDFNSASETWGASIIGTNITDEKYEASIIDFGIPMITPGMGALWKIEGRYHF